MYSCTYLLALMPIMGFEMKIDLGAALGESEFVKKVINTMIKEWTDEIQKLSKIAKTEPQTAYAVLRHGLVGKWMYTVRTNADITEALTLIEDALKYTLSAMTGPQPYQKWKKSYCPYLVD